MPWEFEGPNKNPLRFDDSLARQKEKVRGYKTAKELTPQIHRLILSPLETMLSVVVFSETIHHLDVTLAELPPTEAKFVFEDIESRAENPPKPEVLMRSHDDLIENQISSHLMIIKKMMCMIKEELLMNEEPASLYFFNDLTFWALQKEQEMVKMHPYVSSKISSARKTMNEAVQVARESLSAMDAGLATLEAGLEEALSVSTIMKEYAKNYSKARVEQNTLKIQMAEKFHKKHLYNQLKAIEDEHRANQLIKKFVTQATKNVEAKIASWSKRYDKDVEEIDLKIVTGNQKIPDVIHTLAMSLMTYYTRELEMAQYIRLRNWRIKVEEVEAFMEFFAIKIQAWWRGHMVRWELGQFAPKKVKKK